MRSAAAVVLILVTACSPGGSSIAPPRALDGAWPTFRGDDARDGHPAGATLTARQAARLAPLWRTRLKGAVDGSAVVLDGQVFIGSNGGNLVDLKAADGAVIWKQAGLGPISGSPAVDSTTVYVATLSGRVLALSRSSGAIEWEWNAPGIQPAIWSTPTLFRGMVLVGIGSQWGDQPLEVGRIIALKDGHQAWQICARTDCVPGGGVWSTPAVDAAGRAFIGLGNPEDGVLAFTAATGAHLWKVPFYVDAGRDLDVGTTPVIFSERGHELVAAGSDAGVFDLLDAATGAVVWSRQLVNGSAVHGLIASPAYDRQELFAASAGASTGLFALDAASGQVRWSDPTPVAVYSAPALGDRVVVFGEGNVFGPTDSGGVVALDVDTGKPLWTFDTGSAVRSGPVIAGDLVVVGDAAGDILAFAPSA